jgi:NAD(P)-dependent dehydrogenase (short-subunit alcohol dehydrogenase family)
VELELAGKTALVTGADRGTGQIIAATLAGEGATVLLHGATEDSAAAAAAELAEAVPVWADIATGAGCESLLEQLVELPSVHQV